MRSLARPSTPSLLASIERTLDRLHQSGSSLLLGSAIASSMLLGGGVLAGCGGELIGADDATSREGQVLAWGQKDWAQGQGQRNPGMVSYYGQNWSKYTDCNSRFGCMGVDLFVKIRVRPVVGANLATKKAGLVYRVPGANDPITANGYYFTKWGNGDEEWHVPVHLRTGTQGVITFNAWYQDGKGHTYYDDNNGELHAATWTNGYAVVQHNWPLTSLKLTAEGVTGSLVEQIADLDWDKQIELVWTVDDWRTVNRYGSGSGQNRWRWIQDQGIDYEQWQIDVKIPGSFSRFQYAVVYRHGTVNNASRYEFWDANGGNNWVLTR